jgi:hypothetical protein
MDLDAYDSFRAKIGFEYNDPHIPVLPAMRRYPHLRMESRELTPDTSRRPTAPGSSPTISPTTGTRSSGTRPWSWIPATPRGRWSRAASGSSGPDLAQAGGPG